MDVYVSITVGSLTVDARVESCGPDALHDAMHQAVTGALALAGEPAIRAAVSESETPDDAE